MPSGAGHRFASLCRGFFQWIRYSPEGIWFRDRAQAGGFRQAVAERDSGDPIAPDIGKRGEDLG